MTKVGSLPALLFSLGYNEYKANILEKFFGNASNITAIETSNSFLFRFDHIFFIIIIFKPFGDAGYSSVSFLLPASFAFGVSLNWRTWQLLFGFANNFFQWLPSSAFQLGPLYCLYMFSGVTVIYASPLIFLGTLGLN